MDLRNLLIAVLFFYIPHNNDSTCPKMNPTISDTSTNTFTT